MKKIISFIIMTLFVITASTAAFARTDAKNQVKYPVKLVNGSGKTIVIDKEPKRIVSLSPTLTECLFAIGAGSKLVGRTSYCDYPSKALSVPAVGNITNPSLEKIAEAKPDLVVVSNLTDKAVVDKLEALNIKVLYIKNEESFNGVYETLITLGNATNNLAGANKVVTSMKYRVSTITQKLKNVKKKPSLYYVVGFGQYGDYTATGDTFISNMITMAGGVNAAADGTKWKYSLEKLIQKNPDILICSKFYDTKKALMAENGYKDLSAVKKGKLIEIDENLISRQGPRLGEGLFKLARILHPELFK